VYGATSIPDVIGLGILAREIAKVAFEVAAIKNKGMTISSVRKKARSIATRAKARALGSHCVINESTVMEYVLTLTKGRCPPPH